MLLAIDVGNTNTVFAVFQADEMVAQWRLMTDGRRTADEYAVSLFSLLDHHGIDRSAISAVILSSVVPRTVFPIQGFCRQYFNLSPMLVGDEGIETGMAVKIDNPREVGADMIVNSVGAWKRHGCPAILVDFGTATTFNVIDGNGDFIGGSIAPGINLSIEALHMAAAQLPTVQVADPGKAIGTNTVSAIQSGIFYGYVGLIEGIIARMQAEYGEKMMVIATGGLAPLFDKATKAIDRVEDDLTLYGLHAIYHMNKDTHGV